MRAIGIDTHKRTLAACAVDDVGSVLDERTFSCDRAGFVELAAWAAGVAPDVRIGIEGPASPWCRLFVSGRVGERPLDLGEARS